MQPLESVEKQRQLDELAVACTIKDMVDLGQATSVEDAADTLRAPKVRERDLRA